MYLLHIKIGHKQVLKIEEKSRDGSKKKSFQTRLYNSDGKLIQGGIPTSHLWSQVVTT